MKTLLDCVFTGLLLVLASINFVTSSVLSHNYNSNVSDWSHTENEEPVVYSPRERNYRKSKFFPLFTIIRFSNELCRTTAEETGLCYTRSQCSTQGGSAQGSCAQGLGVCCKFVAQCGGIIRHNATSFQNPNYPSKYTPGGGSDVCQVRVRKLNNVCQLRLNFIAFDVDGPSPPVVTTAGTGATAASNDVGMCKTDSLAITSSGGSVPSLCGNMNGQHIYVPFGSSDTLTLNLLLSSNANNKDRTWNIEILMIPCNSLAIAPVGCLQYFTGVSGKVESFNYQGGVHLANMDYSICVRMEDGMRSIDWAGCNANDVRIMGTGVAVVPGATPACPTTNFNDYLLIMGGINFPLPTAPTPPPGTSITDRFCDASFQAASSFVRTTVRPFLVHFKSDGMEIASGGGVGSAAMETSAGFCLRWQQNPPQ